MSKFALLLVICLLLCSCSARQEETFEVESANAISETASEISSETSAGTTEAHTASIISETETTEETHTVSTVSETETTTETEQPEDEIILTPIASDKNYDAMMCTFSDIPMSESEEDFPDKEVLAFAKGICFGEEPVQDAIKNHNTFNDAYIKKVWSAEDIEFISGWNYDLDLDGEDEFVIYLSYTPYGPMSGGMLIYIDGSNYKILMPGIDSVGAEASVIDAGEYRFLVTYSTGGSHAWKDIYSFETGMPEKVFDFSDGHGFDYKDGVFHFMVKYDVMEYPFVLCTDGVFRGFACEKISREDFEAHMSGGKEYLDFLAEKGDEVTEIYTYGYYSYRLCGNVIGEGIYKSFQYMIFGDRSPEYRHKSEYPLEEYVSRFGNITDELIYDADVWAVREIS